MTTVTGRKKMRRPAAGRGTSPPGRLFRFTENFGRATIGKDEPKGRKTG